MDRLVHVGRRKGLSLAVAVVAVVSGVWAFLALPGLVAWLALLLAVLVGLLIGRRVMWSRDRWQQHVESRRAADRELLRADEGGRTRPPGW